MMRSRAALLILGVVTTTTACAEIVVESLAVGSVMVAPDSVALLLGDSAQFTATVKDLSGRTVDSRTVHWASNDPRVARISSEGLVVATGTGFTTITAESEGHSYEAVVTITVAFTSISAGWSHTCATTSTDRTACWGANSDGKLGDGTIFSSRSPVVVVDSISLRSVTAGGSQSCGLTEGGTAYCWGANYSAQLGTGQFDMDNHAVPQEVGGHGVYELLVLGHRHACASSVDGTISCWGGGILGQLGNGTPTSVCPAVPEPCNPTPVPVSSSVTFRSVTAGRDYSCGLSDTGEAFCWGDNTYGMLGDGTTVSRSIPTQVLGGLAFVSITAGTWHTCGLTALGDAYCWGINNGGQLGTGSTDNSPTPQAVIGGLHFSEISAGGEFTCGLATDGTVYCWGRNDWGELGNGSLDASSIPLPVDGGFGFQSLDAGLSHACAIAELGTAFCWGYNRNGQVGAGPIAGYLVPTRVSGQF
jgi:alpha-tubulin suppressor-like RCC1 family protein